MDVCSSWIAFEGPMPQTRFVLTKALELGLNPIVVINKCDRAEARPNEVVSEVFDLLVDLNANDHRAGFSIVYASGRAGWATHDLGHPETDMVELFETILDRVPRAAGRSCRAAADAYHDIGLF